MLKKIDDLTLLIWVYIVIALPPLSILYFIRTSSSESDLFSDFTRKTPDFSTIIVAAITLPAIGLLISLLRGKMKIVYFWKLNKQERNHIATIALLLSIVLWRFFSVLSFLSYFGLTLLFVFFLTYLPLANSYLSSIDFNHLKLFIFPSQHKSISNVIENILFALVVLLLVHIFVAVVADSQIRAFKNHRVLLSRYPQIKNSSPKIVYYDNKVILIGRRFGWSGKLETNLKYNKGKIYMDLWTDTKIIFTVPLHWKEGKITLWVEKPIEWGGKIRTVKSNEVALQLISRDNGWDKEDDAYFEQLKRLDKEVLKINGY